MNWDTMHEVDCRIGIQTIFFISLHALITPDYIISNVTRDRQNPNKDIPK